MDVLIEGDGGTTQVGYVGPGVVLGVVEQLAALSRGISQGDIGLQVVHHLRHSRCLGCAEVDEFTLYPLMVVAVPLVVDGVVLNDERPYALTVLHLEGGAGQGHQIAAARLQLQVEVILRALVLTHADRHLGDAVHLLDATDEGVVVPVAPIVFHFRTIQAGTIHHDAALEGGARLAKHGHAVGIGLQVVVALLGELEQAHAELAERAVLRTIHIKDVRARGLQLQ